MDERDYGGHFELSRQHYAELEKPSDSQTGLEIHATSCDDQTDVESVAEGYLILIK